MADLELEYIKIRDRLLDELSDEEFVDWLECPECSAADYQSLVNVLLEKDMTDRVRVVAQYIKSNDKSV